MNSSCQSKELQSVGQRRDKRSQRSFSQRGQIIVEYVLLLVVGVVVAAIITSAMVSRNEESPGFLIRKWRDILELVGADFAGDISDEP